MHVVTPSDECNNYILKIYTNKIKFQKEIIYDLQIFSSPPPPEYMIWLVSFKHMNIAWSIQTIAETIQLE